MAGPQLTQGVQQDGAQLQRRARTQTKEGPPLLGLRRGGHKGL